MTVNILAVDDEEYNLEILTELLEETGYNIETAENGLVAKDLLLANPEKFDLVLLDRMMPVMDGLALLKFIKAQDELRFIPVIMQTAKATGKDIQNGLDAGVLYYLTKPFEKKSLLDIIETAVISIENYKCLRNAVEGQNCLMPDKREFTFQSLDQARSIATLLASLCPDPKKVVTGLCELLVNAIEHGNLEIGYEEKSLLNLKGNWLDEVERRMELPQFKDRKAVVYIESDEYEICFRIKDQGKGFDSEEYLTINSKRAVNTHGRGIAIAKSISFDRLEYNSSGNEVLAVTSREQRKVA